MDQRQRTRRFSFLVIAWACILRLIVAGVPQVLLAQLSDLRLSFPTYSETGRNVRFSASLENFPKFFRESPVPQFPREEKPAFTAADAAMVETDYDCSLKPDLEKLLEQPLVWDLTGPEPSVLIFHTHTTESYTKTGEDYRETSAYRTLEEDRNMLSIGDAVAEILAGSGIHVIHDRQIHDYPSYSGSYIHARARTEEILKQYPSICLVLDLHRDALEKNGKQLKTVVKTRDGDAARLMLVVGTNVSRQSHGAWQENLALALKLHVQLERLFPGIMRPLNLRSERFNQDLSTGALLVEVGTAGNTHTEALGAARKLAEAVITLARGTAEVHGEQAEW